MRIGQLSEKTGVSRDALRMYERRGLLTSARHLNGYRDFHENAVALVNMIKLAQSLGFRLSELVPEMQEIARRGLGSDAIAQLLTEKLAEIDQRIETLRKNREILIESLSQVCPIHAQH